MCLLAVRHGDFNFRESALEVHPQGHEREPLLCRFGRETGNLPTVQQQLPRPFRLVVEAVAHRVFGDFAADEPDFIALDHVRRDGLDIVKKLEKNHEISEDDQERLAHDVQKATDGTIAEIDQLLAAKEKEILTV